MADQFENQLPQKSDAKWVRALDASGNPILISKEDLASVVGGLLEINNSWFRLRRVIGTTEEDLNNANQTGMYWHGRGLFNGNGWHGILLVFNTGTYIAKIDINFINPTWKIFIWNHEQKKWD
ncbi:hypothetical protein [Phocaeicola coprophilus]|uniref:hypothetical protein n=1 Tax=Phocaeicola coprophilus TaxID=387090 RepID=UPI0039916C2E